MSWAIYVAIWVVLVIAVVVIAAIRYSAARQLDRSVHVMEGDQQINEQLAERKSLDKMDFWGKCLTAVMIVYGLVLAFVYGYSLWNSSLQLH